MNKIKKILKWTGISIGSLFTFFIVLALVLPTPPKVEEEIFNIQNVSYVSSAVDIQDPIIENEEDLYLKEIDPPKQTSVESTPKVTTIKTEPDPVVTPTGYKVISVVDGDTVKVSIDGTTETLRIIGINTPETVDPRKPVECFGKEASNKAKELLSGKTVILEADPSQGERDKYGRLLRYVFLSDGTDFGLTMIRDGYAYEYTYDKPYKYQSSYKAAQSQAKLTQAGLWSPDACNGSAAEGATTTSSTTSGNYYTSSYSTAKYYYPASCDGWKSLTPKYLKSFETLEALLKAYPGRTLSSQCS